MDPGSEFDTSGEEFTPRKRDTTRKYEEDHTGSDNARLRNMYEVQVLLGCQQKELVQIYDAIRYWFKDHPESVVIDARTDEQQKLCTPLIQHLKSKFSAVLNAEDHGQRGPNAGALWYTVR
ncbi:hypothetical protein MMC07_000595 [Pseudocyphellaria aurata]|nr:hypothetical protein [Pseudocyphellaria aurata]